MAALISVTILAGLGGYFLLRTAIRQPTHQPSSLPPTITQPAPTISQLQPCSITSRKAVSTTDWKTYTNRTYRYAVDYPGTWRPHTYNQGSVSFSSPDLRYSEDSGYPAYGSMVNVDADKSTIKNLDDLYRQVANRKFININAKEDIAIDGTRGLRLEVSGLEMPSGSDVYLIRDGNKYTLQFWQIGTNYGEVFDQMLCTFRFTQ